MSTTIKYKGKTVTSIEGGQTATLHLTGKKLTDDLVIEASGGSNLPTYNGEYVSLGIKLISFTIDGTEYKAVEGMSWYDWVNDANYNTGGFNFNGSYNTQVHKSSGYYVYNITTNKWVGTSGTDNEETAIVPNQVYSLEYRKYNLGGGN